MGAVWEPYGSLMGIDGKLIGGFWEPARTLMGSLWELYGSLMGSLREPYERLIALGHGR